MLDLKWIRDNAERVKQGAVDKHIRCDVDTLIETDEKHRALQGELETLQAERNRISKAIPKASAEERKDMVAAVGDIKSKMEVFNIEMAPLAETIADIELTVPQPARDDVPKGKSDDDNVMVREVGTVPKFDFELKDHVELGKIHDLIDIERGVKLAGSRSYILKGLGARLEHAVMRFVYDHLVNKNYTPMSVPVLVGEEAMTGTGYFPTGRDQAYCVEKDELALIGTSEVSLTSYHRGEILKEQDLPIRYMAQSSCFRREAGTYGKDTHGLYRVHQFQKIEQVILCKNDEAESEAMHNELLQNAESIMQALGLPYRVVYVCTGDLGLGQVRKHDIETWMPSRNAYSETHSCSTFYEFQSRRLKIRYRNSDGKTVYCHSLNNTAIASPRVLIPLLETHQQADGSIRIPECLQPYMGGLTEIRS